MPVRDRQPVMEAQGEAPVRTVQWLACVACKDAGTPTEMPPDPIGVSLMRAHLWEAHRVPWPGTGWAPQ